MATEASSLITKLGEDGPTKEVVEKAKAGFEKVKEATKETVDAITKAVNSAKGDAPLSFRLMVVLGGTAMIVTNFFSIFGRFLTLNLTGAIISLYCVIFGLIIVLLESGTSMPESVVSSIHEYAKFLEFTWGRGLLYILSGTLQLSNWGPIDLIVGWLMTILGVFAIIVGVSTAKKLKELTAAIETEEDLKKRWSEADADGDGSLDAKELYDFAEKAGLKLSKYEIATAFSTIDKNFDDLLQFEEFYEWWNKDDRQIV
uniref:EF-hand domain-containing protein n=1 Tax=Attheya septentrionalis TaxID=420275 RepID=A0A7S2UAN7_9STRA|mmetsp:Transcript_17606/g.31776  ORF Transcript_17606/g.31776 Transcript_17606/m.31776 type:complete len:258 (+) Transcript_17606:85-858(+)|eukprot:CAMPEP_0198296638 /NCGR_PEP_ID=MMETSP1449-20131203/33266_1 /TAXON_ID=420275 /ORGANISM="Attheya septentrionalis, Strain CCMP2084" /LENGTH=257 /DNA_ID=CAMNT_0043997305 /DNA_START=70 /DNA_END=843 /DNA_ORIENTATION=-